MTKTIKLDVKDVTMKVFGDTMLLVSGIAFYGVFVTIWNTLV